MDTTRGPGGSGGDEDWETYLLRRRAAQYAADAPIYAALAVQWLAQGRTVPGLHPGPTAAGLLPEQVIRH